ncbi:hypothetical protein FJM67_04360 [Maribrevibacterium harenarium]|uniref:Uncharacterized protein n=1 Tax=Maribrevibacterium harenarium TaxID=2589817 RepID=A0A501X1Y8_9GAMM|nr:hypothetical protein [Maribrevibacterium harenarium]TPE54500.1 hypothetical protein FJM67_04360 [Maribrevibacterium harenarium]
MNKTTADLIKQADFQYLSDLDRDLAIAQAERAQAIISLLDGLGKTTLSVTKYFIKLVAHFVQNAKATPAASLPTK